MKTYAYVIGDIIKLCLACYNFLQWMQLTAPMHYYSNNYEHLICDWSYIKWDDEIIRKIKELEIYL